MSGEPINEPFVGMRSFVMNTKKGIYQADRDFSSGKFK
jgi:redox-sensitive bicupin YhaK (pirin superfamily)